MYRRCGNAQRRSGAQTRSAGLPDRRNGERQSARQPQSRTAGRMSKRSARMASTWWARSICSISANSRMRWSASRAGGPPTPSRSASSNPPTKCVIVDVPAEELMTTAAGSLKPAQLSELRELALLLAAQVVESQLQRYMEAHGIVQSWGTQERILVCITPRSSARDMLASGARAAEPISRAVARDLRQAARPDPRGRGAGARRISNSRASSAPRCM